MCIASTVVQSAHHSKGAKLALIDLPLSSPLEGEEDAARFIVLHNKSTSPRQAGGALPQRDQRPLPPTPALPLKGGGREAVVGSACCDMRRREQQCTGTRP